MRVKIDNRAAKVGAVVLCLCLSFANVADAVHRFDFDQSACETELETVTLGGQDFIQTKQAYLYLNALALCQTCFGFRNHFAVVNSSTVVAEASSGRPGVERWVGGFNTEPTDQFGLLWVWNTGSGSIRGVNYYAQEDIFRKALCVEGTHPFLPSPPPPHLDPIPPQCQGELVRFGTKDFVKMPGRRNLFESFHLCLECFFTVPATMEDPTPAEPAVDDDWIGSYYGANNPWVGLQLVQIGLSVSITTPTGEEIERTTLCNHQYSPSS